MLESLCEFVLLSANAKEESDENCELVEGGFDSGTIQHIDGRKHIESYNIMLIAWSRGVAYRRGLGIIGKVEWDETVSTIEKTIVLGLLGLLILTRGIRSSQTGWIYGCKADQKATEVGNIMYSSR